MTVLIAASAAIMLCLIVVIVLARAAAKVASTADQSSEHAARRLVFRTRRDDPTLDPLRAELEQRNLDVQQWRGGRRHGRERRAGAS